MLLINFIILLIHFQFTQEQSFASSSSGSFYVEPKSAGSCEPEKTGSNVIQNNVRFIRNSKGQRLMNGNFTYLIPFDDSIVIDFNLHKHSSSSGGYIPNYFHIKLQHGCSDIKNIVGKPWLEFQKAMNMSNNCPIPKGSYILKEFDMNKFYETGETALPANFFYGLYKAVLSFERNGKKLGCQYVIEEVKPLWQKRKKF